MSDTAIQQNGENSFTIVTSLIDINRESWNNCFKRDFNLYLFYMYRMLNMDCYYYIFIDSKREKQLRREIIEKFKFNIYKIKIVPIKIEDLIMYKYKDRISQIMRDKSRLEKASGDKDCPEFNIPDYNIVVNSKVDLVYRASLDNPFNTTHFIWLDGGYGHGKVDVPRNWNPTALLTDKVCVVCRMKVEDICDDRIEFFNKHLDVMIGGVFSVSSKNIEKYRELFYKEVERCMNIGITDDDQYTVALVLKNNPDLFKVYNNKNWYCGYEFT